MMLLDLIRKRRSIRKYLNQPIESEKIQLLLEATLRVPSSRGLNPWEFIVIDQPKILNQLSTSKENSSLFLKNAPLAIVVCADPEKSDVWIEDSSIAATYIQLTAASLGLGSCWVQIRIRRHDPVTTSASYIRNVLGIPDSMEVEAIIGIGYPAEHPEPHPKKSIPKQKVFYNSYHQPYIKENTGEDLQD